MKQAFLSIICTIFLAQTLVWSQKSNYAVQNISPDLLESAVAVVRQSDQYLQVLSPSKAEYSKTLAVTLLSSEASEFTNAYFDYDSFKKLIKIEAWIYDGKGNLVRKLKKKEIIDFKPGEYFVNDERYKKINFPRLPFPYTIEYTVSYEMSGLMFYPTFKPQPAANISVEKARYQLHLPPDIQVKTKSVGFPASAQKNAQTWEVEPIKAFEREGDTPLNSVENLLPTLYFAPSKFAIAGYEGSMDSWPAMSRFIHRLNAEKGELPTELQNELKALVADCPDVYCKIERVYQHLQNNSRYFFVGLGIGGWQPIAAEDVYRLRYGDCKGLSNLLVRMLQSVDVPAYYALIRAGKGAPEQFKDFPNPYFNHAIACVPMPTDTVWLEATSQTVSCGYQGSFTDDRYALIISEQGHDLVRTKRYGVAENTIEKKLKIEIAQDGSAELFGQLTYQALEQDALAYLIDMEPTKAKTYLYKMLPFKNFEIKNWSQELEKGRIPTLNQDLEVHLSNFSSQSGARLFVPIVPYKNPVEVPKTTGNARRNTFQASTYAFMHKDTIQFMLPEGYLLESPMEDVQLNSDFGTYSLHIISQANQLQVFRSFSLSDGVFPKEKYEAFRTFLLEVLQADRGKVVLTNRT